MAGVKRVVVIYDDGTRVACYPRPVTPEPPGYEPPAGWETYPTVELSDDSLRYVNLGGGDYRLVITEPLTSYREIRGGRNVVLVGGEVNIPAYPDHQDIPMKENFGLAFGRQTGIVWVEGLKVHGEATAWGNDVGDALRLASPDCFVINCALEANIRSQAAHDAQPPYTYPNHFDPIQNLGADRITISGCWLAGNSHCAFLPDDVTEKATTLRVDRTQFYGLVTGTEDGGTQQPARLVWFASSRAQCSPVEWGPEVWAEFPAGGALGDSPEVAFQPGGTLDGGALAWPDYADVSGSVLVGEGPGRALDAGMGYVR